MVYAIKNYKQYLLGNRFQFVVDHHKLFYLVNQSVIIDQIVRWIMMLIKYDFEVIHILKKWNVIVNYSLRIPCLTLDLGIDEFFPYPYL